MDIEKEIKELKVKVQKNIGALSIYISNPDGSDKRTWDEQIIYNRQEIKELKENQNHWATLENVTVCRLGIENLEEVLRESFQSIKEVLMGKRHIDVLLEDIKVWLDKLGDEKYKVEHPDQESGLASAGTTDSKPSSNEHNRWKELDDKIGLKGVIRKENPSEQDSKPPIRSIQEANKILEDVGLGGFLSKDKNPSEYDARDQNNAVGKALKKALSEQKESEVYKMIKKVAREVGEYYDKHGYFSWWSEALKQQRINENKEKEPTEAILTIPEEDIHIIMRKLEEYIEPKDLKAVENIIEFHSVFKEFISIRKTDLEKWNAIVCEAFNESVINATSAKLEATNKEMEKYLEEK